MRRVALPLALIAWFVMVFATPREAAADEPSKADKKKASKLVLQASRHKRNGDKYGKKKKTVPKAMGEYAKAATAYIEAYSLVEEPATVFKLAEIYAARGEHSWALRGYLRYLKLEPDGPQAMEAGERIAALEPLAAADAESGKALPEDAHPELDPTVVFGLPEAPRVEDPEPPAVEDPDQEPVLEKKKVKKPRRTN
ncbi:MAG TPA: hypothetical protein VML75_17285, partial [Kofleriaceae bacterium]|nr:hypothetical protein [Kofleriaceae bacterium]